MVFDKMSVFHGPWSGGTQFNRNIFLKVNDIDVLNFKLVSE